MDYFEKKKKEKEAMTEIRNKIQTRYKEADGHATVWDFQFLNENYQINITCSDLPHFEMSITTDYLPSTAFKPDLDTCLRVKAAIADHIHNLQNQGEEIPAPSGISKIRHSQFSIVLF